MRQITPKEDFLRRLTGLLLVCSVPLFALGQTTPEEAPAEAPPAITERATGNFDGSDREITQTTPTEARQGQSGRPVSPEDIPGVRAPKEATSGEQQLGGQEQDGENPGSVQSVMEEVRQQAIQISESSDSGRSTSLKYPEDFPADI